MQVEVFRSGEHTDSLGRTRAFSEEDLQSIADLYNNAVAKDIANCAPVVKGHPQDDAPAYGWTRYLSKRGDRLFAKLHSLSEEFIAELEKGAYKKVSISLYPDLMLKHIGFLGAAAPAVKGLTMTEFSDEESSNIYYSEYDKQDEALENNKDSIIAEKCQIIEQLNSKIYELERDKRKSEFREFCEQKSAIKQILNSRSQELLTEIMENAFQMDMKTTKENGQSSLETLKEFVESIAKTPAPLGEIVIDNTRDELKLYDYSNKKTDPQRIKLHNKALELMSGDMNLSYEEAALKASIYYTL
jgi:hypothetical protein